MPAITPKVLQAERHIEDITNSFPTYVQEYILKKKKKYSPLTLSGYLYDIQSFFEWLIEENLSFAQTMHDIHYNELSDLKKDDVEMYFDKLENAPLKKGITSKKRSKTSVARSLQALRSLFHYLTVETENKDTHEPYFYRNVMLKINIEMNKESKAHRSKRIDKKTYTSNEIDELLHFVEFDYEKVCSKHQLHYFKKNKERDLAILSLLYGSGIRGNECIGLLLEDVYEKDQYIDVIRKGDKADSLAVRASVFYYLNRYLETRSAIYKVKEDYPFVFVAEAPDGTVGQMSNQTLIRLVKKYTKAFGKEITPHKARYTFAKQYQEKGGTLIGLRDQLGHQNIETTSLYITQSLQEQLTVVSKMDDDNEITSKS